MIDLCSSNLCCHCFVIIVMLFLESTQNLNLNHEWNQKEKWDTVQKAHKGANNLGLTNWPLYLFPVLLPHPVTHTYTPAHTLPSFTYGARSPFKVAFTEHCADNDLGREGERDTDLQRPSHHKTRGKRIKLRLYSNSKDFNTLFHTTPPPLSPISPLVFFNWQKLIFRM